MINGLYVKKPIPGMMVEATDNLGNMGLLVRFAFDGDGNGGTVYNACSDQWFKFEFGDVLNVTDPDDVYVIPRDKFEQTYQKWEE